MLSEVSQRRGPRAPVFRVFFPEGPGVVRIWALEKKAHPAQTTQPEVLDQEEVDPEVLWLCRVCGRPITSPDQAFATGPGGATQVFPNPLGQLKVIVTVREAQGCDRVGAPTQEFTWFEGYSWTVVVCQSCGAHLGWHYQGDPGRSPAQFYGLLKAALVEG